jgi:hypothetical protein
MGGACAPPDPGPRPVDRVRPARLHACGDPLGQRAVCGAIVAGVTARLDGAGPRFGRVSTARQSAARHARSDPRTDGSRPARRLHRCSGTRSGREHPVSQEGARGGEPRAGASRGTGVRGCPSHVASISRSRLPLGRIRDGCLTSSRSCPVGIRGLSWWSHRVINHHFQKTAWIAADTAPSW